LAELAKRFSVPSAVHALGVCEQLLRSVRGSSCASALAEAAVVRLAAADKFVDPSSLVERLEQLAGSKKKALTGPAGGDEARRPAGPAAPAAARGASATAQSPSSNDRRPGAVVEPEPIQWEAGWLSAHWGQVVRQLGQMGHAQVAGIIQPARPVQVEGDLIVLAYAPAHEPLRRQVAGALADRVSEALSQLAGRPVRCQFTATTQEGNAAAQPAARPTRGVSSEERNKVENDPAVHAVMDLFGAKLVEIRLEAEPASPEAADETGRPVDAATAVPAAQEAE
jgi:hypothetical protein